MLDTPAPKFLWTLFSRLRRRHFPLSPDDYDALRQALRAGFGWGSEEALRDLCCTLWAKSQTEQEIVQTLFDQSFRQHQCASWELSAVASPSEERSQEISADRPAADASVPAKTPKAVVTTRTKGSLPEIVMHPEDLPEYHFVLVPQFPLSYREVAQAWRRMRQPVRQGPLEELDLEGTIACRCQQGVASEIVLIPRRRNTARLLLLIDRQGSMTPFHQFVDEVAAAIQESGKLERVAVYYFHDVPAQGADQSVLAPLSEELFPQLDDVLPDIQPSAQGLVFQEPTLLKPQALNEVLAEYADNAAVVIISDAGAAKEHDDILRVLDTVAFMKAVKTHTPRYVWLNPLPQASWAHSSASQIARYAPMFALDRSGLYQAVNVLRGQPHVVEQPL